MAVESQRRVIALRLAADDTVREVARRTFPLNEASLVGRKLDDAVVADSAEDARALLRAIADRGAAFGSKLSLLCTDGSAQELDFIGARVGEDEILLVGGGSRIAIVRCFDELLRLNDEHLHLLRTIVMERSADRDEHTDADEQNAFGELMRLNNEMAGLQRELAKKNAALERESRLKNQLLGMAAHDLRNPLGAIRSFTQLLLDGPDDLPEERRAEMLRRIGTSSDFMLRLIDDILALSTIEAGELRLDREPTDLVALVRENVLVHAVLAAEQGIRLHTEVGTPPPILALDANKIEQVLNNLVDNAVKYSAPDSRVAIELDCSGDTAYIRVRDQGPGIPAEEHQALFRPFARTSVRPVRGGKSTGLGLAIASRIVRGHGGRISVESEVGVGSTFIVELPLGGAGAVPGEPTTCDGQDTAGHEDGAAAAARPTQFPDRSGAPEPRPLDP